MRHEDVREKALSEAIEERNWELFGEASEDFSRRKYGNHVIDKMLSEGREVRKKVLKDKEGGLIMSGAEYRRQILNEVKEVDHLRKKALEEAVKDVKVEKVNDILLTIANEEREGGVAEIRNEGTTEQKSPVKSHSMSGIVKKR